MQVILCILGSLVLAVAVSFVIFDRLKNGSRKSQYLMIPLKGERASGDLSYVAKLLADQGLTDIVLIGVDCGLSPEQALIVQKIAEKSNIRIIKSKHLHNLSEDSDGGTEQTVGDN